MPVSYDHWNGGSRNPELVSYSPGLQYTPMQEAILTNGEKVFIAAQNGDGNGGTFYQKSDGEWIPSDEIEQFV